MRKCLLTILILSANFAFAGTDEQIADLSAQVAQLQESINLLSNKLNNQNALGVQNKLDDLQNQIDQINGNVETIKHSLQTYQDTQNQVNQSLQQQIQALPGGAAIASSVAHSKINSSDVTTADSGASHSPSGGGDIKSAINKIKSHDFPGAISELKNIISTSNNKGTVANATYYLAVAYAANAQYKDSIATARKFITSNPQNKNVPDAMRTIYIDQNQLGQQKAAASTAKILIKSYPHSDAAKKVKQELPQ